MDYLAIISKSPYGFHAAIVGAVLICVALVYILGFKSPQEPEFEKLTEDRKSSKKKKVKDKKSSANGHVAAVSEKKQESGKGAAKKESEKSPSKKQQKSPKTERVDTGGLKDSRDTNGNKKSEKNLNKATGRGNKENLVAVKNKKNVEFDQDDDGEWEQAVSRRDKRSKKSILEEILPQKNDKKKGKKKSEDEDHTDIQQPDTKILDVLNEIGLDAEAAVSIEEKPVAPPAPSSKKSGKKKKSEKPSEHQAKGEIKPVQTAPEPKKEAVKPVPVPPAEAVEPKPPRQKKQPSVAVEPVQEVKVKEEPPKPEIKKDVTTPPAADSNVVFDELGDSWKEAKAPKKSSRKKTRVD